MKISKKELIELGACTGGLKRFIKQTHSTDNEVDVISLIGGENTTSDLLWLAGKKLPKEKIVRFAKHCALINIEMIKPYCSDDSYDLIVKFLLGDNAAAADAAYAAAYAVNTAADAAYAAVYAVNTADVAARAAARAAARVAARAAAAAAYTADAADAAYDAAAYAAGAAGCVSCKQKINELLVKLFNEE